MTPNEEMAYKITELYLKHIMTSKDRRDLTIDDVLEKYHYALDQIKIKQGNISEQAIQENMALLPGLPAANEPLHKEILILDEDKKSEVEPSTKDPKRINEFSDDEEIPRANQFI